MQARGLACGHHILRWMLKQRKQPRTLKNTLDRILTGQGAQGLGALQNGVGPDAIDTIEVAHALLRRGFVLQLLIATTAGARFSLKRGNADLLGLDLRTNA